MHDLDSFNDYKTYLEGLSVQIGVRQKDFISVIVSFFSFHYIFSIYLNDMQ